MKLIRFKITDIPRFISYIDDKGMSFCANWIGAKNKKGYGIFSIMGENRYAHRVAYSMFFGDIPEGLVIDHICMNKSCVNPYHLRAVTQEINLKENCNSVSAINSRKTHCKRGHEFNQYNTWTRVYKNGKKCRICIECLRDSNAK